MLSEYSQNINFANICLEELKMPNIYEQLLLHEGLKLKPYRCSANKLTIGVGRNLEDKGITKEEAMLLLENDIINIRKQLKKYHWFVKQSYIRRKVLIDMAFNLGIPGLLKFKKMILALCQDDHNKAADEMIDSDWYKQVPNRSKRLVKMMRTGEDYKE